jgi:hypothetical protein
MIDLLKQIILDFQGSVIESGTPRGLEYSIVNNKAFICIGVRRCGKSTLMYQVMEKLLRDGVPADNILYMNFFDDRLTVLKSGNLAPVMDAYFSLYPEKQGGETVYCFFDEIQEVRHWESFIDRIMRTEKCRVFITGSSAKMLSKEIATQMRGRSLSWELFPFSFIEYLAHRGLDHNGLTTRKTRLCVNAFDDYFQTGGFPEVLGLDAGVRIRLHQEYYKAILNRDIIDRYDCPHPQAVLQLAYRLMTSIANPYSLNRLFQYMKSIGFKITKDFIADCLQWFEDCYFMFSVKKFDRSVTKQNANPKKIYCVDHGLIRSIDPDMGEKRGFLLENAVYMRLRIMTDAINYYRTGTGNEVDFIWQDHRNMKHLVQVAYNIDSDYTKDREIRALREAMRELHLTGGTLVTYSREGTHQTPEGTIEIVPAWKFSITGNREVK